MSFPLVYVPESRDDIDAAYHHFERCRTGLGDRFMLSLRRCTEKIALTPELYGVVEDDFRAAPLRRFPHLVFYRFEADRVLIVAVHHGRRDGQTWLGRV